MYRVIKDQLRTLVHLTCVLINSPVCYLEFVLLLCDLPFIVTDENNNSNPWRVLQEVVTVVLQNTL